METSVDMLILEIELDKLCPERLLAGQSMARNAGTEISINAHLVVRTNWKQAWIWLIFEIQPGKLCPERFLANQNMARKSFPH